MKKIIRLTESDLTRIVRRVIKENEEEWIDQSQDMEGESDFSRMELEKKALKQAEKAVNILSDDEKDFLITYLNSVDASDFQDLVIDEIENMGVGAITEEEKDDLGMSEDEYQVRKIIDKVISRVTVISMLSVVPAAMFISGGVAVALGVTSLATMLLKDVAWWNPKGYDKNQSSIYHRAANRARREDGEGRNPYINEMEDEDFMRGADKNWNDRYYEKDDFSDFDTTMYDGLDDEDDDYGTMRGRFFDDEDEGDEEWGETDEGEEELQDLIEEARDFLENECGYDLHDINLMSEEDIVNALYEEENEELAEEIADLLHQEGFADHDEPIDSIGGHSVNDLKKAFAKTKGKDEELDEGWDDFTQKKRYPEDYKPEKYRSIPKDFFRKNLGHRIDSEGTKLSRRHEKPFDDYEDFDDEEFV